MWSNGGGDHSSGGGNGVGDNGRDLMVMVAIMIVAEVHLWG